MKTKHTPTTERLVMFSGNFLQYKEELAPLPKTYACFGALEVAASYGCYRFLRVPHTDWLTNTCTNKINCSCLINNVQLDVWDQWSVRMASESLDRMTSLRPHDNKQGCAILCFFFKEANCVWLFFFFPLLGSKHKLRGWQQLQKPSSWRDVIRLVITLKINGIRKFWLEAYSSFR